MTTITNQQCLSWWVLRSIWYAGSPPGRRKSRLLAVPIVLLTIYCCGLLMYTQLSVDTVGLSCSFTIGYVAVLPFALPLRSLDTSEVSKHSFPPRFLLRYDVALYNTRYSSSSSSSSSSSCSSSSSSSSSSNGRSCRSRSTELVVDTR